MALTVKKSVPVSYQWSVLQERAVVHQLLTCRAYGAWLACLPLFLLTLTKSVLLCSQHVIASCKLRSRLGATETGVHLCTC